MKTIAKMISRYIGLCFAMSCVMYGFWWMSADDVGAGVCWSEWYLPAGVGIFVATFLVVVFWLCWVFFEWIPDKIDAMGAG